MHDFSKQTNLHCFHVFLAFSLGMVLWQFLQKLEVVSSQQHSCTKKYSRKSHRPRRVTVVAIGGLYGQGAHALVQRLHQLNYTSSSAPDQSQLCGFEKQYKHQYNNV